MRQVRFSGSLPATIAENSGPADWIGSLAISGDILGLLGIEAVGPAGSLFSVSYLPALGLATLTPAARVDYEAFAAAGRLPDLAFSLRLTYADGTRQDEAAVYHVAVLDRDDTPPTALRFAAGGTVTAGEIGGVVGTLAVTDPDSAGPFLFTIAEEDAWRFEILGTTLKLRDGISLGLDDMPHRPLFIEVSDGRQSAGFVLDLTVRSPGSDQSTVPILRLGETLGGFTQDAPGHVLTLQRAAEAVAAINLYGGDVRQVVLKAGGEVWLGPVERLQFADGWYDFDLDGHAAQAASLHHALLGTEATGAELARYVAQLQAGIAWTELAGRLIEARGEALGAAVADADYAAALHLAACGRAADTEALDLALGRLASGTSRAQLAVDLALSAAALEQLAGAHPDGLWVAQPFGGGTAQEAASPDSAAVAPDLGWLL